MAAAAAVPAPVGMSHRGLAVFGPPAQDLVRAVVAAAARHARRGLVDLKPGGVEREREIEREIEREREGFVKKDEAGRRKNVNNFV